MKLSFLAHSLGNSVVTNAIRILSNAFEDGSIGTFDGFAPDKTPGTGLGNTFQLQRLVMVAPDIPVEAVIPRRANVLRSSLRRMRESHVFSNEGDLALRLASTAANYFSFPARTGFSGYRLGNLTLRHFRDRHDHRGQAPRYGIARNGGGRPGLPAQHLEIRASVREHRHLGEEPFAPWVATSNRQVTNLLSFFDCTDAIEHGRGVVSLARRRAALNLPGYIQLTVKYILFSINQAWGIDTHGGYFRAKATSTLIYRLAFSGFDQVLRTLQQENVDLQQHCLDLQIQLALSVREQNRLALHLTDLASRLQSRQGGTASGADRPRVQRDGDEICVRGDGLRLPLNPDGNRFDRLDP